MFSLFVETRNADSIVDSLGQKSPLETATIAAMRASTHSGRPPNDEASIRAFAERVLRDAGYEVVVASDGPGALRPIELFGQTRGPRTPIPERCLAAKLLVFE